MEHQADQETRAQDGAELKRIRTKLMRLMIGSIVITFILVGLVLAAVIYKIMAVPRQAESSQAVATQAASARPLEVEIDGALVSYHLEGEMLIVRVKNLDGAQELILYNVRQQQGVSHFKFKN